MPADPPRGLSGPRRLVRRRRLGRARPRASGARSSRSCDGPAPEPGGAAGRGRASSGRGGWSGNGGRDGRARGLLARDRLDRATDPRQNPVGRPAGRAGGACVGSGRGSTGAGRAERGDRRLPGLPAARRLAGAGGAREAGGVPRRGVLGPPGARLRRPGRRDRPGRPGPGGPRRQPDRADVHRRPLGRLALRRAAPGRPGEPAHEHAARRRAAARRRLHRRRGPLRPAGQPAHAGGARRVPAVPGARAGGVGAALGSTSRWVDMRMPRWRRSSGSGPAPASATARRPRYRPGGRSSARSTRASRTPSPAS